MLVYTFAWLKAFEYQTSLLSCMGISADCFRIMLPIESWTQTLNNNDSLIGKKAVRILRDYLVIHYQVRDINPKSKLLTP